MKGHLQMLQFDGPVKHNITSTRSWIGYLPLW